MRIERSIKGTLPILNIFQHTADDRNLGVKTPRYGELGRYFVDETMGDFTTAFSHGTQMFPHTESLYEVRHCRAPFTIGRYCFVGTRCIPPKGPILHDYSVLRTGSVLAHEMAEPYHIYSGVAVKPVESVSEGNEYFTRLEGRVSSVGKAAHPEMPFRQWYIRMYRCQKITIEQ